MLFRPTGLHVAWAARTPRIELMRFGPCQDGLSNAESRMARRSLVLEFICLAPSPGIPGEGWVRVLFNFISLVVGEEPSPPPSPRVLGEGVMDSLRSPESPANSP